MSIHLVIPGLLWPAARTAAPTRGLALPALEALLGRARVESAPAMPLEAWLGRAFGLDAQQLPHAALRRLGESDAAQVEGEWLCADPVHLHFARDRLLLADASELAISGEEAAALVASLNDFFEELEPDFGRFEAGSPERWYLRPAEPVHARFAPLNEVVGRPVGAFLPEGIEARRWQRLVSEAQILLHDHAVNRAREAAGARPVNSLWLWGGGRLPAHVQAPAGHIQAGDVLTRGLARAAGVAPTAPRPVPEDETLVVLDTLLQPALHLDLERWQQALQRLEAEWFAPLLAALKTRRAAALRISAPGDRATLELALSAGGLWKFWQRPRTLDSLDTTPT